MNSTPSTLQPNMLPNTAGAGAGPMFDKPGIGNGSNAALPQSASGPGPLSQGQAQAGNNTVFQSAQQHQNQMASAQSVPPFQGFNSTAGNTTFGIGAGPGNATGPSTGGPTPGASSFGAPNAFQSNTQNSSQSPNSLHQAQQPPVQFSTSIPPGQPFQQAQLAQQAQSPSVPSGAAAQQSSLAQSSIQSQQSQSDPMEQRIQHIRNAWDPAHPECQLKFWFYNTVAPANVSGYVQPNHVDNDMWAKVERENPDATELVPGFAVGWTGMAERVAIQKQLAAAEAIKIQEITRDLTTIERQQTFSSSLRLVRLQSQLEQLQQRLVHVAAQTAIASQSTGGNSQATKQKEKDLREKLEGVKAVLDGVGSSSLSSSVVGIGGGAGTGNRTMGRSRFVTYNNKPNYQTITNGNTNGLGRSIGLGMTPRKGNGPRLMGQVNELWGALEEVKRTRPKRVKPQEKEPWMDSEAAMEDIAWVLKEMQRVMNFMKTLNHENLFDVRVIREELNRSNSQYRR